MKAQPMLSRRDEYTEATRQALLAAGLEQFAALGYQDAGIEAISRAARVTRGAFYHHFEDKKALFDAVVVLLQIEAVAVIDRKGKPQKAVIDRMRAGIDAYLDVCLEPAYNRIVVQDAPVVLGATRFREIEELYPMARLAASLDALKRDGEIDFDDTDLLCRLIDAMICKVAVMLSETKEPKRVRRNTLKLIDQLLAALRPA